MFIIGHDFEDLLILHTVSYYGDNIIAYFDKHPTEFEKILNFENLNCMKKINKNDNYHFQESIEKYIYYYDGNLNNIYIIKNNWWYKLTEDILMKKIRIVKINHYKKPKQNTNRWSETGWHPNPKRRIR